MNAPLGPDSLIDALKPTTRWQQAVLPGCYPLLLFIGHSTTEPTLPTSHPAVVFATHPVLASPGVLSLQAASRSCTAPATSETMLSPLGTS